MYSFSTGDWAQEIVDETQKAEYQNATIRIFDVSQATIVTPYDPVTGAGPEYSGGDIYEGRARVIGVRWGVHHGGGSQRNAYSEKAIRVQVPYQAVGRVKKGCTIFVSDGDRNPVLEDLVLTVTNDFQGAMAASRTIECALNGDSEVA